MVVVSDLFDSLVGQTHLADALRHYARSPVHAYLFHGADAASTHDAITVFAAALECPAFGCGACDVCRRVLAGVHPDVHVTSRAGLAWRVDELRDVDRVARRRPLEGRYNVVVIDDVELTVTGPSPSAAALLKSLEEPATRTVYLLGAGEVGPDLETVVSRCVRVELRTLSSDDVAEILVAEGAEARAAREAATASGGDVRRARVLVRDPALAERLATWRAIPERLRGTPASAGDVVRDVVALLDEAITPLVTLQSDELERRQSDAREMGQRVLANRRELEAQGKREQRRFRVEEIRHGLGVLTALYRERLHEGLRDESSDARAATRVRSALAALDALAVAQRRAGSNIDETLLLYDLALRLSEL